MKYLSYYDSNTAAPEDIIDPEAKVLISFQSGMILPPSVLSVYKCYNFHAASPEFPGRDPHHWAIYREAKEFGVTLHVMTENVDEGPILAVTRFDIVPGTTPAKLRKQTESMAVWMFDEMLPAVLSGKIAPNRDQWGKPKNTRQDLLDLCQDLDDRKRFAFKGFV